MGLQGLIVVIDAKNHVEAGIRQPKAESPGTAEQVGNQGTLKFTSQVDQLVFSLACQRVRIQLDERSAYELDLVLLAGLIGSRASLNHAGTR